MLFSFSLDVIIHLDLKNNGNRHFFFYDYKQKTRKDTVHPAAANSDTKWLTESFQQLHFCLKEGIKGLER